MIERVKIKITALACCILLASLLAGCGKADIDQAVPPTDGETVASTQQTLPEGTHYDDDAAVQPPAAEKTDPDTVGVETPWGTLFYEARWADVMLTEQEQTGDSLYVRFYAEMDGCRYDLFTVTIGADEANAGQITDYRGTARNVFVTMEDPGNLSDLKDEQKNVLYAMQEQINFVIGRLRDEGEVQ